MQDNSMPTDQPFWVDDPNPYLPAKSSDLLTKGIHGLLSSVSLIVRLGAFGVLIYVALKLPIMWIAVILYAIPLGMRIFVPRLIKSRQVNSSEIQLQAKERTGADVIGSALHTAGHPLLQANQPVVLALKGDELSLYDYKSSTPIDSIRVKDLQSIETVVYDEDRVPHIGVADNTAQALQITFNFRGNPCTCVFRRMYKVRAIEWYQAIHKSRFLG